MRRLIILILVLATGWSAYWYVGKSAKYAAITLWLDERRAAGWVADHKDFRVVGFPNRFDSQFTALKLGAPRSGLLWEADAFQILALSYKPNHIIAAFSPRQFLTIPGDKIEITSTEMLASVVFQPDTNLAVQRLSLETKALDLNAESGWRSGAEILSLATRMAQSGAPNAHDIAFDATALRPTEEIRRLLNPEGDLPALIDKASANLELQFDAPWDRVALESGAPFLQAFLARDITVVWGDLRFEVSGQFDVSASGAPIGELDFKVKNWRRVLAVLINAGAIPEEMASTISTTLELLTSASPTPGDLNLPLSFRDAKMFLGPIPIGSAPLFLRR